MAIKIEIKDSTVTTKTGLSRSQRPYTIHEQTAYLHSPTEAYPVKTKINLNSRDAIPQGLTQGFYELDDSSFYVDKYGSLALNPVLVFKSSLSSTSNISKV